MSKLFQVPNPMTLLTEPRNAAPFTSPKIVVDQTDRLEIIAEAPDEVIGGLTVRWVKVRCAKGEGFLKRDRLRPFAELPPLPDEELPIELRRTIEIVTLAEMCFRHALLHRSNSAIVLALAFAATGSQWTTELAKAVDADGRIGIFGMTRARWAAGVAAIGEGAGFTDAQITSSRAQCELAAFLTGADWPLLETGLGSVRAIDLYLSFLVGPDIAIKVMAAKDDAKVATLLSKDEQAALATAVKAFAPAAETKGALVTALVASFDAALDFVRAFAERLVTDNVPGPVDAVIPTADEITEDPTDGSDEGAGSRPVVEMPPVVGPEPQPGDGSILVSEAHLVALWKRSMFPIDGRGIIAFGLRGCLPVDPSGTPLAKSHKLTLTNIDYKKMRCTIGQWRPGHGFAVFPGSTVPYVTLVESAVPGGGTGVNQMGRGRHLNYTPGWHKRMEGRNGHWALLQDSDTTFQRTSDDLDYDRDDKWGVGRPGDNIHCAFHMGTDANIPDSRYSSAGCQVVAGTVIKGKAGSESGPWKKFIAPFLDKTTAPKGLEYVLFDGREVQQMVLTQLVGKTVVLRFGSEGPLVKQLQQRLGQVLGMTIKVDGRFNVQTFQAVLDFQQQTFGRNADDGIVGPETAEKLGIMLPPFVFEEAIGKLSVVSPAGGAGTGGGSAAGSGTSGPVVAGEGAGSGPGTLLSTELFEKFTLRPSGAKKRAIWDSYVNFFVSRACQDLLDRFKVSASKQRLAHFFAQAAHETGGFTLLRESLHYTTVAAIRKAWKSRASSMSDAEIKTKLLGQPVALGDWAYGDRMGNKQPGDGFAYRGGGVFQTTGRSAYREKGKLAGVDLERNPELIERPEISTLAACAEWDSFGGNALADADKVRKISRAINIGNKNSGTPANGEADRIEFLNRLKALI